MNAFRYFLVNIIETLLRVFPIPCKTGMIKIGNPDRSSPVLLTCNFHLTVERVKRALKGMNCYLLVANSRGINVWCSATGGLFTNHDVISVLKISGVEEIVDHHQVILPQLAATGVQGRDVKRKTGWKVIWGPVYAKDIPAFLKNNLQKTPHNRQVSFPLLQRIEIAVSWAFPMMPVLALVWGLAFLIFLLFPLYERWLTSEGKRIGFIFFDFGKGGFQIILWAAFMLGLVFFSAQTKQLSWGYFLRWAFVSFLVILLLSIDLMGSTPTYKSSLHEDRLFKVILDKDKCRGAGFCEQVCPRNCFEVYKKQHTADMPRSEQCVQCGACIVQCPYDALYFQTPNGEVLTPETVRKYKVNLIGKRLVQAK